MKEFIKCKICGKHLKRIHGGKYSHLNLHNLTFNEYKEKFPTAKTISDSCREKHKVLGNNMPRETIMKMVKRHMNEKSKLKRVATWRERGYDKKMSERFSGENSHMKTQTMRDLFSWRMRTDGLGGSRHASSFITKEMAKERGKKIAETNKKIGHYKRQSEIMLAGKATRISSMNKNISKPQKELFEIVKTKYPTAELNKTLKLKDKKWCMLDVAVSEKKIDFEFNGIYWHRNTKQKDLERQKRIEELGWKVININENTFNEFKNNFINVGEI